MAKTQGAVFARIQAPAICFCIPHFNHPWNWSFLVSTDGFQGRPERELLNKQSLPVLVNRSTLVDSIQSEYRPNVTLLTEFNKRNSSRLPTTDRARGGRVFIGHLRRKHPSGLVEIDPF